MVYYTYDVIVIRHLHDSAHVRTLAALINCIMAVGARLLLLVSLQTMHLSCPDRVSLLSIRSSLHIQTEAVRWGCSIVASSLHEYFFSFWFLGSCLSFRGTGTRWCAFCWYAYGVCLQVATACDIQLCPGRSEMQGSGTHTASRSHVVHVLLMLFILARPLLVKIPRVCMHVRGWFWFSLKSLS